MNIVEIYAHSQSRNKPFIGISDTGETYWMDHGPLLKSSASLKTLEGWVRTGQIIPLFPVQGDEMW